nr:hypothetical protein [Tanacetum cinerariifolium]
MADENNTLTYEAKTGAYSSQLDETSFVLDANLPRDALEITPIDQAHQFVSPPLGDAIMDFVNQLGYTEVIHFVSRMTVNNLYQPWRAILSMINQCLTGKTSRRDRPRYLLLQMLWGLSSIIWEEFTIFIKDKHLRFILLKKTSDWAISRMHHTTMLTLEMVAKHHMKMSAEKEGKKKTVNAKQPKSKPAVKKQLVDKPDEEPAYSEPEPKLTHQGEGDEDDMELTIQMSLESFQAESQAHTGGVAIQEHVAEATRPLLVVEGKCKAIETEEQAAQSLLALHTPKRRGTTYQFVSQRQTLVTEEASTGPSAQAQDYTFINIIDEEQGKDVDDQVNLDEKIDELDQGQAGADPGKTPESRPPPEQGVMDKDQAGPDPGESRGALAGPDPEPTHDEFMADLYPKVQESLKFLADEHVMLEEPLSLSKTLSSMKNLDDAYTIRDKFINDKSTEDELGKIDAESEVVSMVTVPIHQASSSITPLSTPIIDLSPPKPASSMKAPIFTATTKTTTTTLPPPP